MDGKSRGFSLVEILIMVVIISVVATAFWNLHLSKEMANPQAQDVILPDSNIQAAMDEMAYHIKLAGRGLSAEIKPIAIKAGHKDDKISIYHNNTCYEFFLDRENIMERVGNTNKVVASNIASLKFTKMGEETIIVTIAAGPDDELARDGPPIPSRSFSTVVHADGIY